MRKVTQLKNEEKGSLHTKGIITAMRLLKSSCLERTLVNKMYNLPSSVFTRHLGRCCPSCMLHSHKEATFTSLYRSGRSLGRVHKWRGLWLHTASGKRVDLAAGRKNTAGENERDEDYRGKP